MILRNMWMTPYRARVKRLSTTAWGRISRWHWGQCFDCRSFAGQKIMSAVHEKTSQPSSNSKNSKIVSKRRRVCIPEYPGTSSLLNSQTCLNETFEPDVSKIIISEVDFSGFGAAKSTKSGKNDSNTNSKTLKTLKTNENSRFETTNPGFFT